MTVDPKKFYIQKFDMKSKKNEFNEIITKYSELKIILTDKN